MNKTNNLPYGVCRTYFYNSSDRVKKRNKRPCMIAYFGGGKNIKFKAKRFPIDTLGEEKAFHMACSWRSRHAPLLRRASDITKKNKNED